MGAAHYAWMGTLPHIYVVRILVGGFEMPAGSCCLCWGERRVEGGRRGGPRELAIPTPGPLAQMRHNKKL